MNLKMLLQWALTNDVPLDDELTFGDHFNTEKFGGVIFNKGTNKIILLEKSKVEPKVLEVIASCQCPRSEALRYLQQCNWNVPLAVVTYRREQR